MEEFNSKTVPVFENEAILDLRKVMASVLIVGRDNHDDDVDKIMAAELLSNK